MKKLQRNHTSRPQREHLIHWFQLSVQAMQPEACFKREVRIDSGWMFLPDGSEIELNSYRKIWLFGAGKGAFSLAEGVLDILGNKIAGGVVIGPAPMPPETPVTKTSHSPSAASPIAPHNEVAFLPGDHPLPLYNSVASTGKLLEAATQVQSGDLVLFALTGGASAMLCKPVEGLSLEQKQAEFKRLLSSGASIHEMNVHRRKLSLVKGGKLLEAFNGADVVNFILSDVPHDDLNTIGSAPTQPFDSGYVLAKKTSREENQPVVWNALIATPALNARFIAELAESEGYQAIVDENAYTGSSMQVAHRIMSTIKQAKDSMRLEDAPKPRVLLFYGESEVSVKGEGKGGRNQHLALQLSLLLASVVAGKQGDGDLQSADRVEENQSVENLGLEEQNLENRSREKSAMQNQLDENASTAQDQIFVTILSAGTDGIDGNTDAAGAICTESTALVAQEMGLSMNDYLQNFDSYTFFTQIGDIFIIGPTGTNLTDLQIVIVHT